MSSGVTSESSSEEVRGYNNYPPVVKFCSYKECMSYDLNRSINIIFCPQCGNKMDKRLKAIYIEISSLEYDKKENRKDEFIHDTSLKSCRGSSAPPMAIESNSNRPPERISMKDFVRWFRAYEKEVFIDEI